MKWISRFLAGLLALALIATALAWVLGQTIWDQNYIVHKTEQVKLANQLAPALSKMLAANAGSTADGAVILGDALTPEYIQGRLDTLIPALERYYREGGQVPRLDLSDLKSRITAAGYVVPPELAATLERPQDIHAGQADGAIRMANQQARRLQWVAPLAAALLAGLIALLARRRRWLVLAGASLSAAIGTALLAVAAWLPVSLVQSTLANSSAALLAEPIRTIIEAVAQDQSGLLVWAAVGMVVTAAVFITIHLVITFRSRFRRPPEPVDPAAGRGVS